VKPDQSSAFDKQELDEKQLLIKNCIQNLSFL